MNVPKFRPYAVGLATLSVAVFGFFEPGFPGFPGAAYPRPRPPVAARDMPRPPELD